MKSFPHFLLFLLLAVAASAQLPMRFEQRIGERLPLESRLVDEAGHERPLGDYFSRRPVLLIFGYYKCTQLCSVLERNTIDRLRDLQPIAGRDFDVVYVSIDPTDGPAEARIERAASVRAYGRGGTLGGWHYLTGTETAVRPVAAAAGFAYRYDSATRQYAHPTGFVLLTPGGLISRYFLGLDFRAEDLATALRRADQGKTGEPVFNLVLECFRGDGLVSRNARWAWRALQAGVALTLIGLFSGIGWMLRDEFRRGNRRKGDRP